MATILVTGGSGYIGSHTVLELLNKNYDVVVVDNFSNSSYESIKRVQEITGKTVKFYENDIRDVAALEEIFQAHTFDAVIHFAAFKAVGESCKLPLKYYDNNISGTITLCKVMKQFGCPRLVFSSSATVYGEENPAPLREQMPVGKVANPYARTKLFNEQILQDLCIADEKFSAELPWESTLNS